MKGASSIDFRRNSRAIYCAFPSFLSSGHRRPRSMHNIFNIDRWSDRGCWLIILRKCRWQRVTRVYCFTLRIAPPTSRYLLHENETSSAKTRVCSSFLASFFGSSNRREAFQQDNNLSSSIQRFAAAALFRVFIYGPYSVVSAHFGLNFIFPNKKMISPRSHTCTTETRERATRTLLRTRIKANVISEY